MLLLGLVIEKSIFDLMQRIKGKRKLVNLDFSGNVDSAEFASPEWLSDFEVVDRPIPFLILIH